MYKGNGDFMKKRMKDERGSLIVEATIVFPVTFLVVIFLLFVGNLYYQRSKAQAVFTESVIETRFVKGVFSLEIQLFFRIILQR